MCEPTPPSNYGAEAAAKFSAQKRQEQERLAANWPYTGYVKSFSIVDESGAELYSGTCPDGDTNRATSYFLAFITHSPEYWIARPGNRRLYDDCGIRWYCFDARYVMTMFAAEVFRNNAVTGRPFNELPVSAWWHEKFAQPPVEDPYEMLVPSNMRVHMDLYALCDFMGVQVDRAQVTGSAVARARLARELAVRGQLNGMLTSGQAV